MDIETIRRLAGIVCDTGLSSLEAEQDGLRVKITKDRGLAEAQAAASPESFAGGSVSSGMRAVTSPMVGVFYQSPAPGEKPFVQVGGKVKKGDVLCIIEAMKLMNEITADTDGEIADICVSDGDVVEYGQILFKLL